MMARMTCHEQIETILMNFVIGLFELEAELCLQKAYITQKTVRAETHSDSTVYSELQFGRSLVCDGLADEEAEGNLDVEIGDSGKWIEDST
jgi:cob(I)alamin adenosyltransferase